MLWKKLLILYFVVGIFWSSFATYVQATCDQYPDEFHYLIGASISNVIFWPVAIPAAILLMDSGLDCKE